MTLSRRPANWNSDLTLRTTLQPSREDRLCCGVTSKAESDKDRVWRQQRVERERVDCRDQAETVWAGRNFTRERVDRVAERAEREVERIRACVHEIASTGLTLSKLSVAASLLGDLVKN